MHRNIRAKMHLIVKTSSLLDEASDAVVLCHWEGERFTDHAARVDKAGNGRLRALLENGEFSGRLGQVSILHAATGERLRAKRVVLAGLGKRSEASLDKIRQALGTAAKAVREVGAKSFSILAPGLIHAGGDRSHARAHANGAPDAEPIGSNDAAQAMVEGALLGLYQFNLYRTENAPVKEIKSIAFIVEQQAQKSQVEQAVRWGQAVADATTFVRDLCNHPANVMTPTYIATEAKKIARDTARVGCTVLNRMQMQRIGMGAMLGVARGSHEPPKFIVLEYQGGSKNERPIALVGKTVTFDSGGISIKPADNMEQMKADMTGGAAVLAAVGTAARMRLPLNVVGIIPATENMPGGSATKPGDVLTSLSGKTIEVINTDAEGRLILADGLTYATRYNPEVLVDIATLTGACVVALGNIAIGVLGNNQPLIQELKEAGEQSGERTWQLPLWDEYYDLIKSDVADVKNTGGRPGGTITAAAFLSKFIGKAVWAHLDIASTDWSDREKAYLPKGPTGVGVRLLIQFLRNRARGRAGTGANGGRLRRKVSRTRARGKKARPTEKTIV